MAAIFLSRSIIENMSISSWWINSHATFKLSGIINPCLNIVTLKRGESSKGCFILASYTDALWAHLSSVGEKSKQLPHRRLLNTEPYDKFDIALVSYILVFGWEPHHLQPYSTATEIYVLWGVFDFSHLTLFLEENHQSLYINYCTLFVHNFFIRTVWNNTPKKTRLDCYKLD